MDAKISNSDEMKNVLEDAEKNQDDWDVDSFDTAPKINLDDYNGNYAVSKNINDITKLFVFVANTYVD